MIIDGKKISLDLEEELKKEISSLKSKTTLAVVLVGDNPASKVYVKNKIKACQRVGINSVLVQLEESSTFNLVKDKLEELSKNDEIDGILLQLPLPKHLDEKTLMKIIPKEKDVDGFSDEIVIDLFKNNKNIFSCTPSGIIYALKEMNVKIEGSHCVIIGRSEIVGKPLALALLNENATVTICHSKTKNIEEITKTADILIAALGKANFVKKSMVKENSTVIDVGINRIDNKLVGDVDFDDVKDKVKYITPVPGGIGPLTISFLLKNTLELKKRKERNARK